MKKKKDNIEVYFNVDGQETKYILLVNELIQDYLIKSHKEFLNKAKELSQK